VYKNGLFTSYQVKQPNLSGLIFYPLLIRVYRDPRFEHVLLVLGGSNILHMKQPIKKIARFKSSHNPQT